MKLRVLSFANMQTKRRKYRHVPVHLIATAKMRGRVAMPKNYIDGSIEINKRLEEMGIPKIIPDKNAPKVFVTPTRDHTKYVRAHAEIYDKFICPYFGPGGSDNTLKALRAWCDKNDRSLQMHGLLWWIHNPISRENYAGTEAKADGEALYNLLWEVTK